MDGVIGEHVAEPGGRVLWRQGRLVPSDLMDVGRAYPFGTAGDGLPAGTYLVTPAQWLELVTSGRADGLAQRGPGHRGLGNSGLGQRKLAVVLDPDDRAENDLQSVLDAPMIVVRFKSFVDGRGYSIARLLRTSFRFTGELIASGDILRDQIPLLSRCGFDTFEIADRDTIAAVRDGAFAGIPQVYQAPDSGSTNRSIGGAVWRRWNFSAKEFDDGAVKGNSIFEGMP